MHLFTKKISENLVKQQFKTLKSLKDKALDPELFGTMFVDYSEINKLHLERSSTCCDMNGFYFMQDTIVDISFCCRYHTNVKQQAVGLLQLQSISSRTYTTAKEQCSTKAKGDIKQRELQEGTLTWMDLDLLNSYGISKAFNLDDIRRHKGNAELRTILFKEEGNDTVMDSLQSKTKQEELNCINALTKPIEPTKLTDFCLKIKEITFKLE